MTIVRPLLDFFFPPRCLVCDRWESVSLCAVCEQGCLPIPEPFCLRCGRPVEETTPCRHCAEAVARWGDWSFGVARAAGIFQGPLRAAVHRLKYNDLKELATPLGALLANRMIPDGLLIGRSYEAIVALPLHPARERERGYNQAHLLAAAVAEMTGIPLLPMGILTRTQRTDPQARLSLRARRAAITPEMFTLTQPNTVTGKSLLLVDDVFTTGTTVNACATTLIQAGAASVDVATLAAGG